MKLHSVLKEALQSIGGLAPVPLGGDDEGSATEEWKHKLLERLEKEAAYNKRVFTLLVAMCVVLFVVGLALVVYYLDEPRSIQAILGGGSLLSILAVMTRIQRLMNEKTGVDILLTVVPTLPPKQVVRVVQSLYYGKSREPKAG